MTWITLDEEVALAPRQQWGQPVLVGEKRAMPSGTVTFLFTDVEGSTRLWSEHPTAMAGALRRHDELIRGAIAARDGVVFSTAGDAFAAAFHTPVSAADAAMDAQRSLDAERWPGEVTLRVRMGLHTGVAEERGGDYFGPTLNRGARIMAAGHGGQILVSEVTAALLATDVLTDLGTHRLKDLPSGERLWQLGPGTFGPLRTIREGVPHNLPAPVDAFIGRCAELEAVDAALRSSRVVTLIGVGGVGKTRLALESARSALKRFVDGVWLVEFASVAEGAAVPFVIGDTVRVVKRPGRSMLESLADALTGRRVLLVLDNCEHLLDRVADVVATVTERCPEVAVLATSREGLGIRGEQLLPVGSLPGADAEALFVAVARRAGFDADASDPAIGRIVARLDGLPLAIELAAARTRGLSIAEIEERIIERFRLLRGSSRGRTPRHQTLWNTVEWSHQLLDDESRAVFDRLSVFAGGFTLAAAVDVCAADEISPEVIEEVILGLVDRSMLLADPTLPGTRYRLLETLRQFGEVRLLEDGSIERVRARHADHYARLGEAVGAASTDPGADPLVWEQRGRAELDNYRVIVYGPDRAPARRIVAAIGTIAIVTQFYEFVDWALEVIEPADPDDIDWMACAVIGAWATHYVARGDDRVRLLTALNPDALPPGLIRFYWLNDQAAVALTRGEPLADLLQSMRDIAAAIPDASSRIGCRALLLLLAVVSGDLEFAAVVWTSLERDHSVYPTDAGPSVGYFEGIYLATIGDSRALGRLEHARSLCAERRWPLIEQLSGAAQVPLLIDAGDLPAARRRVTDSVIGHIQACDHLALWISLHHLTRLLLEEGRLDDAVGLWTELRDRGDWTPPAQRSDLTARLGPHGTPTLDDRGLIARASTLVARGTAASLERC